MEGLASSSSSSSSSLKAETGGGMGERLKYDEFRTMRCEPRLAVIMAPFFSTMVYGLGSKGGVSLLVLGCLTNTWVPGVRVQGAVRRLASA